MTNRYFYYDLSSGRIVQEAYSLSLNGLPYVIADKPEGFGAKAYVQNNTLVEMPIQPSEYDVFDYQTKQWFDPRTPETQWPIVKQQRDKLLQASDYTQLPDVPLTDKTAWATYRQQLRDITLQSDPFNIVWPIAPQG